MLINITTGKETFSDPISKTTIGAYFHKSFTDKNPVNFINGSKDSKTPFLRPADGKFYSASNFNEHHGFWQQGMYNLPDNSMVTITIERRGSGHTFGEHLNLLLVPRPGAAYRDIAIALSGHQKAALHTVYIEGRFDIVTEKDFEKFGISIPERMIPENYEDDYEENPIIKMVSVKEPETESLAGTLSRIKTIKTTDGKIVKVKTKLHRKLQLSNK